MLQNDIKNPLFPSTLSKMWGCIRSWKDLGEVPQFKKKKEELSNP